MLMCLCVSIGIVDDFNLIYTLCSFNIFLKEMIWPLKIRNSKKYHVFGLLLISSEMLEAP